MKKTTRVLRDIVNMFVSIPKGLWVTLTNWSWRRPSVTELYPEVKPDLPENYRGMPSLVLDPETHRNACIACGACARMCPEGIITVTPDKSDPKDRKPAEFKIDISRCMWCGLCMELCPKHCLKPLRDFEHACYSRECMVCDLKDLLEKQGIAPAPDADTPAEPTAANPADQPQAPEDATSEGKTSTDEVGDPDAPKPP